MTTTELRKVSPKGHLKLSVVSLFFIGLLLSFSVISILTGSAELTPKQVLDALTGNTQDATAYNVIWNLRLPRILLAIIIGVHFSLSGLILQSVLRNSLADPSVIGVSGGASLAIVVFLLFADVISGGLWAGENARISLMWLPFAALFGGLLAALLVLSLSWKSSVSPARMALNGVAVGAIFNALVMWTIVAWGGSRTEISLLWLAGSLYGRDFQHILILLPWTCLALLATFVLLRPLSILRFNTELAHSLGLRVRYWRVISVAIAVALAASAIAVAGPIGFVGLIVPHLARLCVGSDLLHLAVISALAGACLVLAADILSRTLVPPLELPVGALTTMIGIPVLLFLLQRQSRGT